MTAVLEAGDDLDELDMLAGLLSEDAGDLPTPGALAKLIDPRIVQTPALDLLDAALVDAAERRQPRLIFTMPPQEGKSQRVSRAFPFWLLKRSPDTRIAVVSYADRLARRWGRQVRNDITDHAELGLSIRRDTSAANEWQLEGHDGGMVTVGIGGGLTGRPVDCLIIDDPFEGQDEADSETFRDRAKEWWRTTGSMRLSEDAIVIVLMTRWHEDDLAGWLLAEDPDGWRHINIPALADHKPEEGQTDPLGRQPGEWMISARGRTVKGWERRRRDAGTRGFNATLQGRPSPASGNVWKREWWRRYRTPLWSQHPDAPEAWTVHDVDELIISADCAFKDTKASDYVAIGVWARVGGEVFLLDQICKRLTFTETLTAFIALCNRWPEASLKLVEDKANGTAVIDSLRKGIPGIVPVTPKESKYARANAVAPFIESGNVYLPAAEIALFDTEAFIDEVASFPFGAHDDQVDQTSQALNRLKLRVGQGSAFLGAMKARAEAEGITVPDATRGWRARRAEQSGGRRGAIPAGPVPQGRR